MCKTFCGIKQLQTSQMWDYKLDVVEFSNFNKKERSKIFFLNQVEKQFVSCSQDRKLISYLNYLGTETLIEFWVSWLYLKTLVFLILVKKFWLVVTFNNSQKYTTCLT
jgi:hypothetical protein